MKTELKFGSIITTEQPRDAVHVAVAPIKAGEALSHGQHVGLKNGEAFAFEEHIGVVDPFLKTPVEKGQTFWLFLYPQTITSLRHEWVHPAFDAPAVVDPKQKAIAFLTKVASDCGVSYERMMDAIERDYYIHMGDNEYYKDVMDAAGPAFEEAVETVLGKKPGRNLYPFSCSC